MNLPERLFVSEEDEGFNPSIYIEADGYGTVAQIGGGELATRRAQAAELVRRWNAFEAMREALEEAFEALGSDSTGQVLAARRVVSAALAAAKGE